MGTIKLFQQNTYLKACESEVVSIDGAIVVLDQTVFFPTGGGQSCDLGYIASSKVLNVYEKDGIVYHEITNPDVISIGERVSCRIDWERRFDNMQRHCGEHILSGVFFREFGGVNRGFHMGDDYMTIDIHLEDNPKYTEVTWDMALEAERRSNEIIWSNTAVTVTHFEHREDAEKMPLRKELAFDEAISIVCVGDPSNAADCVACCGTHPNTAGQVGLLKLYKVEKYKDMFRVYFEAGKRALLDYEKKHDLVKQLGIRYSAAPDQLADKLHKQEMKLQETKNELHLLKKSVINQRIELLKPQVEETPFVNVEYQDLKVDDLLHIGRPLIPHIKTILFLIDTSSHTVLLFSSGEPDCGKLVKENASIYNGKGGGNATSARAIFTKREYLVTFIDLIKKHLR